MHDNVRLRAFASGGRQVTGVPALFTRHRGLARSIADGYFWAGAEKQDIRQEAEIGLWIACRNWDPAGGASFRTFADMVVRRRLVTMLQVALREKHRPLNEALTGTVGVDDGAELLVELLPSALDTERVVVARETLARMVAAVAGLSELEREALARVANGDPYAGEKSIDNAAVRARDKLRKAAA